MTQYTYRGVRVDETTYEQFLAYGEKATKERLHGAPTSFVWRGYSCQRITDGCHHLTKDDVSVYFGTTQSWLSGPDGSMLWVVPGREFRFGAELV